jgi:heat-inducible transcriptional repressor
VTARKALHSNTVNERAQYFLKILVERYIREGHPVGSRTLAKDAGRDLSPATVRNVMADLEEMGLVISPHTSAGRIPTATGFRMFVDSLLILKPPQQLEVDRIRERLESDQDPAGILESASQLLSGITRMAGVVSTPRHDRINFRRIEFLDLSERRVLTILVTSEGEVHNSIIHTDRDYSESELSQAANYLNETFSGRDMRSVRAQLVQEMQDTREHMDRIMRQAVTMAGKVFDSAEAQEDCVIAGQTNLMGFDELASMDRLRRLFDAFTEKHEILHLLDKCMQADGVQIFIGEESGYELLDDCSLVTAPYTIDDEVVGVLGVIGPTRMAYDRVIPIVDITAKLLGAALKPR